MTALRFVSHDAGGLLVRSVRAPMHLDESCGCGEGLAVVVALDPGWWLACAVAPLDEDVPALVAPLDGEDGHLAIARCSAAFGLPWAEVTVSKLRAQLVVVSTLKPAVLEMLAQLEPEAVVELRRGCPRPADVVRALSLMASYAESTQ